jgi:hypothetical protein
MVRAGRIRAGLQPLSVLHLSKIPAALLSGRMLVDQA